MDTNQNCDYKIIEEYRNWLSEMLKEYEWEWFVSLNVPKGSTENTRKKLNKWTRNLSIKNHIRIGYMGFVIYSKITGNHIHLLILGKNKFGQTLLDMDQNQWEIEWKKLTHRDCYIEPVYSDGVFEYITNPKNTPPNHFEMVNPYGIKLLKKHRRLNSYQM